MAVVELDWLSLGGGRYFRHQLTPHTHTLHHHPQQALDTMAAMGVDEELASVQREISGVNDKIVEAEEQLKAKQLSDDDKTYWRVEKTQLRAKETQLRDKELVLLKQRRQPEGKHLLPLALSLSLSLLLSRSLSLFLLLTPPSYALRQHRIRHSITDVIHARGTTTP
jgi:hypothetical protein